MQNIGLDHSLSQLPVAVTMAQSHPNVCEVDKFKCNDPHAPPRSIYIIPRTILITPYTGDTLHTVTMIHPTIKIMLIEITVQ